MPIKRIQLRGISRKPSDRLTEDGGCDESLNVQIDNTELAPVVAPKTINGGADPAVDEQGRPLFPPDTIYENPWSCVYLHKGPAFTRAILLYDGELCIYNGGTAGDERDFTSILSLEAGETIKSVTSVGNMLVVSTNQRMARFLQKPGMSESGGYIIYGGTIPFPKVAITAGHITEETESKEYQLYTDVTEQRAYYFETPYWNSKAFAPDDAYASAYLEAKEFVERLRVDKDVSESLTEMYSRPVFVKYSLVLLDGSEIPSDAYLIMPKGIESNNSYQLHSILLLGSYTQITAEYSSVRYTIRVSADLSEISEKYSDIVKAVRFYVSEDILPEYHESYSTAKISNRSEVSQLEYTADLSLAKEYKLTDFEKYGNYYLVKEISVNELSLQAVDLPFFRNDTRVVRQRLVDNVFGARSSYRDAVISNYNGRLLASGMIEKLCEGPLTMPSDYADDDNYEYQFWYIVNDSINNTAVITGPVFEDVSPVSYLTYPSNRCSKAIVRYKRAGIDYYYSVVLKEHPLQNMSFFIDTIHWGLSDLLTQVRTETYSNPAVTYLGTTAPEEITGLTDASSEISRVNTLYLSALYNPFVFVGSQEFPDEILRFAPLTKPLSTGQVGQFDIYIFTGGGIHSVGIASDGTFTGHALVSRDVCIRPNLVTQLDQAIAYLTDRGLMLITGSDPICISDYMRGRPYSIDQYIGEKLEDSPWEDLVGPMSDEDTLMLFLKSNGAAITYDYAGNRIICFSPAKSYAYTYHFGTQTWHKIFIDGGEGFRFSSSLNAYPSSWVALQRPDTDPQRHTTATKVLDYSTYLDELAEDRMKAVVITRPFDLGEPDVRKVIKSIRIRGEYNRKNVGIYNPDVKYILLASMDGLHFGILDSLRSGSYKCFRIVVLADLQPNERISWLEIDYETRFANKIR